MQNQVSLNAIPFLEALHNARSVLLCGCGGGCDVYSTLPFVYDLTKLGIKYALFNLSFACLDDISNAEAITLDTGITMYGVVKSSRISDSDYFPERALADYLATNPLTDSQETTVYTLSRRHCGVTTVRKAYSWLINKFNVDAIVTVDAGTDSLMKGNEDGLGSYEEDLASVLAAGAMTSVPLRLHLAVGLGVDSHHSVSDVSSLRAISELRRVPNGYLGAITLLPCMAGYSFFKAGVEYALKRDVPQTITNCCVIAAVEGEFGSGPTERTHSAWVNSQMAVYHGFSLDAVVERIMPVLREKANSTVGFEDIQQTIVDHIIRLEESGLVLEREEYPQVPFPPFVRKQRK